MEIMQVTPPVKRQSNLLGTAQTGLGWYGIGKAAGPAIGKGIAWGKGAAAGGSVSEAMGAAGPVALGTAGMAFGMKARGDVIQKGEDAGNYKYDSPSGPDLKAPGYKYDAISRRMNNMGKTLDPKEILDARKQVDTLPLPENDKINIGKKLSDMLNFIKIK